MAGATLNFPSSPSTNDTYSFGGKTWVYNGSAWALQTASLTTTTVTEGTNLYFTNARSRSAISVSGAGSYDTATGVITITGGVTSVGGATGAVSNAQLASGITSSGVLTTGNVAEGANLYFTTSRARASIDAAAGGPITYSSATGNVALSASGVTANTYGGASKVPVFTVDTYGRITSAANVNVAGVSTFSASGNTFTIGTADGGSFSASIQPDSVTLGRDTTGNYVGTLTAGTGISITGGTGEGSTPTITNDGVTSVNGSSGAITNVAKTTDKLSAFAATTSSELATVISDETGTGNLVFSNSPTLVSPILGTPQSATLTNATGLPISTGVSGLGSGVATFLGAPTSANLRSAVTDETGSGSLVFSDSPVLITPNIGTPSYSVLTNATGLPVSTGISGLGAGVATFLATPSSSNLASALTDESGSNTVAFTNSPVLVTPNIGTPSYAVLTNATGLPLTTGISGLGTGQTTLLGSAAATGVTANTYGGASKVPVITVDQYGRITSASNVSVAGVSTFTASGNTFTIGTADGGSFAASIQPDSVQLGRDTTGAYVGNLTAGTGVTLTNLAGENATPTIAIGQAVGTSADVSFNTVTTTANVNVGGTLNVTGNLNVQGTTTTFNSTVVEVADSIIYLATGNSGDVQDIGIAGHFTGGGGYQHTGFVRDASDGEWKLFANVATEPTNNTLDFTSATYSPIRTGALTASSGTISGNISAGNAVVTSALTAGTLQTSGNVNANNLRVATNSSLGTVVSGTWNGSEIGTAYTAAKVTSVNGQTGAATGFATTANSLSQFASTTSSELATLISDETGSGALVFGTSPTLVTPILGTPQSATLTNATGLPVSTGISGLGTGVAAFLATPSSANLATAVTDETGTGTLLFSNSPAMVTPNIGTPSYAVLTNATGLPVSSGITGLGANVATFLADPTSAKLAFAVSDETGSGNVVFSNSPTLVTPILGTPQSATLTNATGLPVSTGISGLGAGVATFLANPTSANLAGTVTDESGTGTLLFSNSPAMVTPNIGTPSYAVLTNATGLPVSTGISGLGANQTTLLAANAQSGVTATTYGSTLNIPVITVDVYGRVTSASNVAITSGVSSVGGATGAISNAQLASSITSSGVLTTANVSEVTNLYFTNARSRASISAGSGISYDSGTGVVSSTITQNNYNDASARASVSITGTKGSYNSGTGVFDLANIANVTVSSTAPGSPNVGDTWIDDATGKSYLYYNDGTSSQWVEQASGTVISSLVESVAGSTGAISNAMIASGVITSQGSTGSGSIVLATTPTLVTPVLGLATGTSVMLSGNIGAASGNVSGNFTAGNFQTTGTVNVGTSITVDGGVYGNVITTAFGSVFATANNSNPYSIMQVRSSDGTSGMGMQAYAGTNSKVYSNSGFVFVTGATVRDRDYPTGGTTRATLDSTGLAVTGNVTVSGNLTVQGTVTTISSTTLDITDKNITVAKGAASSAAADGAGITVDGASATFNYVDATTAWTSSQDLNLASGKVHKINGTQVLSSTGLGSGILASNLTSVGTITTGTWNGTTIAIANGGSGTTTAQGAMNAFAGAVTSGSYLRGNGTNVVMSSIQAGDVPTLNQNTTGSAATLTTPRAINGVNFDGSAAITVTAAAGTLSGATLASGVTASSLTSVGTIATGVWQGTAIATTYGGTGNSTGYASGGAASAATATVVDDTSTNATYYPMLGQATSGNTAPKVSSTKLTFNPSTGQLTATDLNSSSDKRLKKNIKTVTSALDTVGALRGVTFDWREGTGKAIGLIAQEVQEVLPEIVSADDNGYLSIRYNNVVGVLIEAIKELKADFEAYKKTHP